MGRCWARRVLPLMVLAPLALSVGCVDGVFEQSDPFQGVVENSGGYVGYVSVADKQTVCASCHTDKQAQWEQTKHASAEADLQASGAAADACQTCHTVNTRGNVAADSEGGWTATPDARYHDVQCESCHGPGESHVGNPQSTQPLASVAVGTNITTSCTGCHRGTHQPYVAEWAQSKHARAFNTIGTRTPCRNCHSGKGALEAFGVDAHYLEADSSQLLPLVCVVCHAPHDNTNEHQLRLSLTATTLSDNLCMKCHQRMPVPDSSNSFGPHSPEGPVLLGLAGYRTASFNPDATIVGPHGTPSENPRLCARCHVHTYDVKDAETGAFTLQATSHRFLALPCVDASGAPTTDPTCVDSSRSYASCVGSGCHRSQSSVRTGLSVTTTDIQAMNDELKALLERVPQSEFNAYDNHTTTAEGARFNSELADYPGSIVHNPWLIVELLRSSIEQVQKDYGL
jgi:hypothetical protein